MGLYENLFESQDRFTSIDGHVDIVTGGSRSYNFDFHV